jgi:hypothetical protein
MASVVWIRHYQKAGCSVFEYAPVEREDYPGRRDLIAGYKVIPELWQRAHADPPQSTADLACSDEAFYYVKLDGRDGLDATEFVDRGRVEDALDEALSAAELGCVERKKKHSRLRDTQV